MNGDFIGAASGLQRAIQEVKRTRDRNLDRLQTTRATDFNPAVEFANEADVIDAVMPTVMFTDKLGASICLEHTKLAHVRTEIDLSGLELEFKFQVPDFQILNANLHGATAPEASPARTTPLACKRMRRKGFGGSMGEPKRHPYSWRETLLRTDYKDKGLRQAVSNGKGLRAHGGKVPDNNGFGNAVMRALAVGMDEVLDESEAAFKGGGSVAKSSLD